MGLGIRGEGHRDGDVEMGAGCVCARAFFLSFGMCSLHFLSSFSFPLVVRADGSNVSSSCFSFASLYCRMTIVNGTQSLSFPVITDDVPAPLFSPHPKSFDQAKPSWMSTANGTAGSMMVPDNVELSSFAVLTVDPELHRKISLARPSLFSYDREIVTAELVDWSQRFLSVPYVNESALTALGSKTAFSIKLSCLQPGSARVVVHVNVVPTKDKKVRLLEESAPFDSNGTNASSDVTPIRSPRRRLLSTSSEDASTRRYAKLISFSFMKECFSLHLANGSPIPGLMVSRHVKDNDVVVDGLATASFSPLHAATMTVIPAKEIGSTFYVRLQPGSSGYPGRPLIRLLVNRPIVTVADPAVVAVTATGELERARTMLTRTSGGKLGLALTLTYACKSNDRTTVTVQIPTSEGDASFVFTKDCLHGHDVEGTGVRSLMIGTSATSADVVKHGITSKMYRQSRSLADEASKNRSVVPAEAAQVTFYIHMDSALEQLYRRPLVFSEFLTNSTLDRSALMSDSENINDADSAAIHRPIAYPILKGSAMTTNKLTKSSSPLELTVVFRCTRFGLAEITVRIPLVPAGSLSFSFEKQCHRKHYANETALEQFIRVPGFNVGVGADNLSNVVRDGIPSPEFHWSSKSTALHYYDIDVEFASFVVSYNDAANTSSKSSGSSVSLFNVSTVVIEPPTVFSHYRICEPELAGSGSSLVVLSHESQHTLTVTFKCVEGGESLVIVALPITAQTQKFDPTGAVKFKPHVSSEQIVIAFVKRCPYDSFGVADAGGVALPGFSIGTSPNQSDVVNDGFPRASYFGQRTLLEPNWGEAMVSSLNDSLPLFLWYSGDSGDDAIELQAPALSVHSAGFAVELSGDATKGVRLERNGDVRELTLNFECHFRGVSSVTVSFSVLPHGTVSFTVPKTCDGDLPPRGVRLTNLFVGTSPGGRDVVEHGITKDQYTKYKPGDRGSRAFVNESEWQTTFYIRRPSTASFLLRDKMRIPSLEVYEPVVYAHRAVCNPVLENSLRHTAIAVNSSQDATNDTVVEWEDGQTLKVTADVDTINITYYCVWEGDTALTVLVPLFPKGQFAWTFTKRCRINAASALDASGDITVSSDDDFRNDNVHKSWRAWDEEYW